MLAGFASLLLLLFSGNRPQGRHHNPHFQPGRTTIVHLFEWKWNDIADECEKFLGPYGYGGVQVSPPNENAILWEPSWDKTVKRPWYERYQPVSYKLFTRSGSETEFREMVRRCNNVGVRIYVDTVFNHMTGNIGAGQGTAGSHFDPSVPKYDAVPYGPDNFNKGKKCPTKSGNIESYNDKIQVRNCRLAGLADLDLGQEYVRNKIAEYMNKLIEIGVAGFRVDAAKHMWPADLQAIYGRLNNLNEATFGSGKKPFIYQEVIDLGGEAVKSAEYVGSGRVTEFKFGMNLGDVIRKNKNKKLKQLRNFGEGWKFMSGNNALAFVDNHDNQRGHGAGGYGSILTHRQSRMYKMAVAFMLAWPYGVPRVMSSFNWPEHIVNGKDVNDWVGPPHDENYNIKSVKRNSDLTCGNGWVCEHRWQQIFNMVKFRNVVGFEGVANWWDNDNNQIAFSRGNKGFIAINNEEHRLNQSLQTGLPQGTYCDIISGNKEGNRCTGRSIQVGRDGKAQIQVDSSWEDPMIAIHIKVSKPLIEKRRRARINRSLSQLVEMVAKPNKIQENRTARFEKAYILEMTVEFVKKIKDKRSPVKPCYDEHENSFQDGYRLCMTEIQNFFNKSPEKKPSEDLLMKSLLKYLCRKLKVPSTSSDDFPDAHNAQIERSQNPAVSWLGYEATEDYKTSPARTSDRISMTSDYKSEIPRTDSCSSASLPSTEDEGTFSVSESESSISDEKVFYDRKIQNEVVNKILLNQGQTETKMWRPW